MTEESNKVTPPVKALSPAAVKRKQRIAEINLAWHATKTQKLWRGHVIRKQKIISLAHKATFSWPEPLKEDFSRPELNPPLFLDATANLEWIGKHRKILIRTVTWNLCALPPPPTEYLQTILPRNRFHMYVIGTEECERSIAQSAINPSKKNWESDLQLAVGALYVPLRSHTLQAIHLMAFVHHAIVSLITEVTSAAIPMGIGNAMGNKGSVALSFKVAATRFVFVNAHLEAHQNAVSTRNVQINRTHRDMALMLKRGVVAKMKSTIDDVDGGILLSKLLPDDCAEPLDKYAERLVLMGDFNYRVNGNRDIVDSMLRLNMHKALLGNDQLRIAQASGEAFVGYTEAPLNFRPTYKFEIGADDYDTSSKRRIPSWTDRILFMPNGMQCIAYNADTNIRTSDHRPVFASFKADIEFGSSDYVIVDGNKTIEFLAQSQVCCIS